MKELVLIIPLSVQGEWSGYSLRTKKIVYKSPFSFSQGRYQRHLIATVRTVACIFLIFFWSYFDFPVVFFHFLSFCGFFLLFIVSLDLYAFLLVSLISFLLNFLVYIVTVFLVLFVLIL